jgi:hypothetical protein
MRTQSKKQAPQFYCYGRPKTADLEPLSLAAYLVLKNARGIMVKGGMGVGDIRRALVRTSPELEQAISEVVILDQLITLEGLGMAERLASNQERWRKKA